MPWGYFKYSLMKGLPGGSVVKNLLAMWETLVQSPGPEHPLEKEMATHSTILSWEIPWTKEPGGLQSMELEASAMTEGLNHHHQSVKNLPAMQETWEGPLEKERVTHSSILSWRIPWTQEPGG